MNTGLGMQCSGSGLRLWLPALQTSYSGSGSGSWCKSGTLNVSKRAASAVNFVPPRLVKYCKEKYFKQGFV